MKTIEEIRELSRERYGTNPFSFGGQRDGFVIGYKMCQEETDPQSKWIKIESEDDLPKINDKYWIIDKSKDIEILKFDSKDENYVIIWKSQITHYQPIVKPEPPIY